MSIENKRNKQAVMNSSSLKVRMKYLDPDLAETPPEYATAESAGIDLRAMIKEEHVSIRPGERLPIPTGLAVEPMQAGVAGFLFSRSGLGAKKGLTVSQGVGVIDPDYRGEIIVSLLNTSQDTIVVTRGMRVAQLVFLPYFRAQLEAVDELSDTERGAGGFGHTGHK
jgi:dUTP pyrophosphatase